MLEEGCGHTDTGCLHLSGWCQLRNWAPGRPVWVLEHQLPQCRARLGPLMVPGSVRECFIANKTFKWV